jgi:hypothetical protein
MPVIVETKVLVVTDLVGLFQQALTLLLWPASLPEQQQPICIHVAGTVDSLPLLACLNDALFDYRRWGDGSTGSVTPPAVVTDKRPRLENQPYIPGIAAMAAMRPAADVDRCVSERPDSANNGHWRAVASRLQRNRKRTLKLPTDPDARCFSLGLGEDQNRPI